MRFILLTLYLAITAPGHSAATDCTAPVGNADTARVITLVSSIPLAVDLAAYDLAEAAFAPKIVIDYTSLWGGEPSTMTPAELMAGWRGIVPGFDATWHELGMVSVEIDGDSAKASANVDARHWIEDQLWRPIGVYYWDLTRTSGGWRITRMVFDLTQEIGDRALARKAMERAAQ
ncbi:MAG: nuclear transport factor 2 family protein [Pseudomonadota bacterium]